LSSYAIISLSRILIFGFSFKQSCMYICVKTVLIGVTNK
jgi:hypothetical protein